MNSTIEYNGLLRLRSRGDKAILKERTERMKRVSIIISIIGTLVLVLGLALPVAAQEPPWPPLRAPAHCKITGGGEGWYPYTFEEEDLGKHRISFGFTAISTGTPCIQEDGVVRWPAKGQFHLVDHTTKEKVKGTIDEIVWEEPDPPQPRRIAVGDCTFAGDDYRLAVEALDAGEPGVDDWVRIELIKEGEIIHTWVHDLEGGNIQIKHKGPKVELEACDEPDGG